MPRASAVDAARTAQRVLEFATALFAERGFREVSLADVALAAGVTLGEFVARTMRRPRFTPPHPEWLLRRRLSARE